MTATDGRIALLRAEALAVSLRLPGRASGFDLDGVDLCLMPGSMHAVLGRSGSGKTTLLQLCGLLSRPDRGALTILGVAATGLRPRRSAALRRRAIGFVFQSFNLVPHLSALDNVMLAALGPVPALRARATARLGELGLAERLRHRPGELSAGEQQRVAFARATLNRAPILLADEPTGNLDALSESMLIAALRSYADAGNTVLIATHSDAVAAEADVVHRMSDGKLLDGTRE